VSDVDNNGAISCVGIDAMSGMNGRFVGQRRWYTASVDACDVPGVHCNDGMDYNDIREIREITSHVIRK
jgi:hypothetical protein